MGFWGSLFGGQNTDLNADIGTTSQTAGKATNLGFSSLNAGTNFEQGIVSGDATKQMQAVAPEVSAAKTSAAQTAKTNAMEGGRTGGTAAFNAATSDKLHSDITNLIGSLTGGAVSNLLSSGSSLLGTGLQATGMNADIAQQRYKNWEDSILGRGVTTAVSAAEAGALSA